MSEGKNCIYLYVLEGTKTVIGCLVAEEVSEFYEQFHFVTESLCVSPFASELSLITPLLNFSNNHFLINFH